MIVPNSEYTPEEQLELHLIDEQEFQEMKHKEKVMLDTYGYPEPRVNEDIILTKIRIRELKHCPVCIQSYFKKKES